MLLGKSLGSTIYVGEISLQNDILTVTSVNGKHKEKYKLGKQEDIENTKLAIMEAVGELEDAHSRLKENMEYGVNLHPITAFAHMGHGEELESASSVFKPKGFRYEIFLCADNMIVNLGEFSKLKVTGSSIITADGREINVYRGEIRQSDMMIHLHNEIKHGERFGIVSLRGLVYRAQKKLALPEQVVK